MPLEKLQAYDYMNNSPGMIIIMIMTHTNSDGTLIHKRITSSRPEDQT